jgi:O-antigen ligase
VLAALGGASRADELQQSFVRFAAIASIAAALWPLDPAPFRDSRGPLIGLGLVYLLLLMQLVPMPPDLWARMPGHGIYSTIAQRTGTIEWRPWTLSPDLTLNALAALLPATAIGLLTFALDFRGRLVLARLIVGIGCFSAVLGMLQFAAGGTSLHLFRTTSENSAVGLFANRNHEAVLMACSLPLLAALASIRLRRDELSKGHLGQALAAGALLLMGATVTGSRMGLLLSLVGLGTAIAIILVTARRESFALSRASLAAAIAALGAIVLSLTLLLARSGAAQRLAADPVDQTRLAALAPMLKAARAFFPFGAGFGTFDEIYRRFEPDALLSTIYLNQAHNEPAQLAIEGGAPALTLLLLFLAWWARACVRAAGSARSASRRALAIAMVAVTLILMLSSAVDYPLRTPLLSGIFAIACVELLRSKRRVGSAANG